MNGIILIEMVDDSRLLTVPKPSVFLKWVKNWSRSRRKWR